MSLQLNFIRRSCALLTIPVCCDGDLFVNDTAWLSILPHIITSCYNELKQNGYTQHIQSNDRNTLLNLIPAPVCISFNWSPTCSQLTAASSFHLCVSSSASPCGCCVEACCSPAMLSCGPSSPRLSDTAPLQPGPQSLVLHLTLSPR